MRRFSTVMDTAKAAWEWLRQPTNLAAALFALIPIYLVIVYMDTYGRNVPTNDHWLFGLDIATATKNGTLSLEVILRDFAGHRIFFTGAQHALFTALTDWNVRAEMWVNLPLAMGEFLVLVLIFRRIYPHLTAWVLVPFSMVIFSLYQYLNWLNSFYTIWHFVPLFFLLGLYSLLRLEIGWRPVILAIVFSFCATFSLGPGVVTWVTVLMAMLLLGYRRPLHYGSVIVALLGTLYLYTREVQVQVASEGNEGFSSLQIKPFDQMSHFFLSFIGNPFTAEFDDILALRIAIIGIVLFAVNILFLWRWEKQSLAQLTPWLTMAAFAFGVAALITLTRYRDFRWLVALEQRYTVISSYFWLALIATIVAVIWAMRRDDRQKSWQQGLMVANLLVGVVLVGLYCRANIWNLQATASRFDFQVGDKPTTENEETCLQNYPLRRDDTCIQQFSNQLGNATPEKIYQVAAYGLTIFANDEAVNILPESYEPGSPIILDTPSRWLNLYVRDWLLDGVPAGDFFHIAPPEETVPTDTFPTPLGEHVYTYGDPAMQTDLGAFITDARQIWLISTSETAVQASEIEDDLWREGYIPLFIPIKGDRFKDADFEILRFLPAPEETRNWLTFANNIHLKAWEVREGMTFTACDTLTVESWWAVDETPDFNYSATLFLTNAVGDVLASAEGQLADVEMGVWVPDLLFFDSRSLTIPCDLGAGVYELRWRVYNYETLDELLVDADGGTRARLTQIDVK
jgi:hypothetical protein